MLTNENEKYFTENDFFFDYFLLIQKIIVSLQFQKNNG